MDLKLRGKTALITGASAGIGRAIAHELALEGVRVGLVARHRETLEQVAAEIESAGGAKPVVLPGDLALPDDIVRVVAEAKAVLGPIGILINNAGSSPSGRIQDTEDATWLKSINLKLMGYARCAAAAYPE